MNSVLSIISSPLGLFLKLRDEIRAYQSKKKTREQLLNALNHEIDVYFDVINRISDLADESVPSLQSLKEAPLVSKFSELISHISVLPMLCIESVDAFIDLCKRCQSVSKNEAFMHHLFTSSPMLHDFIDRMGDAYEEEDKVRIGEDYYTFFSIYEDEILKDIQESDIEEFVEEAKIYMEVVKKLASRTKRVSRVILKRFKRNYLKFYQEVKMKMVFEGTI